MIQLLKLSAEIRMPVYNVTWMYVFICTAIGIVGSLTLYFWHESVICRVHALLVNLHVCRLWRMLQMLKWIDEMNGNA